jgi:hypothetical protein
MYDCVDVFNGLIDQLPIADVAVNDFKGANTGACHGTVIEDSNVTAGLF